ncbi:hypothetical protein LLH06_19065 [Mucilaginibacter daejeonensis]|uniref:hypothetical protein n=1 Tax=Mucilaginibacter daejeonensis TaxID=398049 RepID=UPI001D171300|nr:hypothetical protein [Mucilaginibacter daejeonensis]UEG53049.1 hypothetical protein LLH06_19065 [Mucilaginibacter daejeonensis]
MKHITTCLIILTALTIIITGCRKETVYSKTFTGKIVYNACGTVVIQVTNDIGTIGTSSWAVPNSTQTYQNAFMVKNYCYVDEFLRTNRAKTDISFRVSKDDRTGGNNCAVYTCFVAGPAASGYIYDIN